MKATNWIYLGREAALLLLFAYVLLFGGGFAALVDFRLQLATSVVVITVLGGWLAWRTLRRERLLLRGVELALLAFVGSQFLAAAFSEDPRRSVPMAITWLGYVLVFFLVTDLLRRGWPAELFEKALLIIGAMVLIFALLELVGLFLSWRQIASVVEFAPSFQQRLSGVLGDPNLLAAFTNLLVPLALARAFASGKATRWTLVGFIFAGLIVMNFTDSRGGLLSFAAGLFVLAILWVAVVSAGARRRFLQAWTYLKTRRAILILLVALNFLAVGIVAWQMLSFQGDTTHAPALEARDIYWQAAASAFTKDPVSGVGPNMYPVFLMQIWSTPPARPYLHAHSFPLQVAAESGLVGLAALAWLLLEFGKQAWRAWRELDVAGRARWAAALAALAGLGVHSLADDFFPFPAVGVTAMVLMAFVIGKTSKGEQTRKSLPAAWLLVPGLAAAIFTGVALTAYWHADQALAAGAQGDWSTAAEEMHIASAIDPSMAIYHLQTGYAGAMLARNHPDLHLSAISEYEHGIESEPYYALSRANLGLTYWQTGDKAQGLQGMRIATLLAPEAWQFWLQQGLYEEDLGLTEEAMSSYGNALQANPKIAGSVFWLESQLRGEASAQTFPAPADSYRTEAIATVGQARQSIALGQIEIAEDFLTAAYTLNEQEVSVYVALGELALAQGQLEIAQSYVEAALWIQSTNNQSKIEAILLAAEIAHAGGDQKEAERMYEVAYTAIVQNSSYGWGSAGWSPYAWFVFQRTSFAEDLIAGFERPDITIAVAERLMGLAELYEEQGLVSKANKIRSELAPYLP